MSNAPKPITPLAGTGYVKKPSANTAKYEKWCKADLWSIERAILLLINAETLPGNNSFTTGRCDSTNEQAIYDAFMDIWHIAEKNLKTGLLKKTDKSYPSLISEVLPIDFIYWATAKDYPIPDELQQIAEYEEWRKLDKPLDEAMSRKYEHNDESKKAFDYGRTTVQLLSPAGAGAIDNDHLQKYLKWREWTPEQAVCLLYGINPEEYTKIADSLDIRTFINAAPKVKMTPYQWQQFGIEHKLPLPKQIMLIEKLSLESQTETLGGNKADIVPVWQNEEPKPWQVIDFVSLDDALTAVLPHKTTHDFYRQNEEYLYSEAARILKSVPLKWVEQPLVLLSLTDEPDIRKTALYNDNVSSEGLEILAHAIGWHERESQRKIKHIEDCLKAGIDPNTEPMGLDLNKGKYPRDKLIRVKEIGFNKVDLIASLETNGIEHTLKAEAVADAGTGSQGGAIPGIVNDCSETAQECKQDNKRKRGPTEITIFLTKLCQKQDINNLSGESLVRAIKPLVNTLNCPAKKYHGLHKEVCVEWKPGNGSNSGTWGKKSFQNFVSEFKRNLKKTR